MPRPRKWRTVCCLPKNNRFGPLDVPVNAENIVTMTIDEYETIRLIDLNGFTQEECASQMDIARTTVQGIYNEARRKVADFLVNGRMLMIEGGDYKICNEWEKSCGNGHCYRNRHGRGRPK